MAVISDSSEMASADSSTGHYSGNQHPTPSGSEKIAGRVFGAIR